MAAIARALATNPPLILADEPTANLDTATARHIVGRLRALADSGEHGVILATHDLRVASQADRVLSLRDGRIVKETAMQPAAPGVKCWQNWPDGKADAVMTGESIVILMLVSFIVGLMLGISLMRPSRSR